ncbi:MAG: hypothetical protein K6D38_11705 [Pseudobutyrivibrio sp.]|nr:hypothetical protein [Pseudobutyrivibrio sp.]
MSEQNGQNIINELSNAKNDVMELLDFINHLEKQSDIDVLKPEEKIILREVLAEYGTEMELTIDNVNIFKKELNETLKILNDYSKIESMVNDEENKSEVQEIEAELQNIYIMQQDERLQLIKAREREIEQLKIKNAILAIQKKYNGKLREIDNTLKNNIDERKKSKLLKEREELKKTLDKMPVYLDEVDNNLRQMKGKNTVDYDVRNRRSQSDNSSINSVNSNEDVNYKIGGYTEDNAMNRITINELVEGKNHVNDVLEFINYIESQDDIDKLDKDHKEILRENLAEYGKLDGEEMELTIDNVNIFKKELNETLKILNDYSKIESIVNDEENKIEVKEIEAELLKEGQNDRKYENAEWQGVTTDTLQNQQKRKGKEVAIDSEEEISRYYEKSEDVAATEEKIQEVKAKRKLDSSASNREQNVNNDVIKHCTENIDGGGSNFRVVATENNNSTVNNNLSQAVYDNNARNDTEKESWRRKLWRNIKKPLKSNPLNACFGRCMGRK